MKSLLAVLAKLGLTSAADLDEATAVTQVTAKFNELQTATNNANTELTQVKAKLGDTEKKYNDLVEAHATSVVDAAIQAGRIPGQNAEVKAKWVGLIKADPTNASLLPEPNPALQQLVQASAAKNQPGGAAAAAAATGEHAFMVQAKAYAAEHKTSEAFAVSKIAAKDPQLYEDYRASLLSTRK